SYSGADLDQHPVRDEKATLEPAFPEDIERIITDALLDDTRDMCGTMSLVASRFNIWARVFMVHTVVVRRRKNWKLRIREVALPNARCIRILVLNLPHIVGRVRRQLPDVELSLIRELLKASADVRHLSSLYLIWDGVWHIAPPSLRHLQHPEALLDLTVAAPPELNNQTPFNRFGQRCIPMIRHCVNLAYLTYASDRFPNPGMGYLVHLKATMMVVVSTYPLDPFDVRWIEFEQQRCPAYSAIYMPYWNQLVGG
ncbi:hypothetical protein C8J57DRAFT_1612279, partial [Mycena rebaudengoi]